MPVEFDVAYDKLSSLETAREIADLFRGYGVKGTLRNAEKCAISQWMHGQTGLNTITNAAGVMAVDDNFARLPGKFGLNTKAMRCFICSFDAGQYPDLVRGDDVY